MAPLVRAATPEDIPEIIRLLVQLAPDDGSREAPDMIALYGEAFSRAAAQGQHLLVVAEGNRICGTLALIIVQNLSHQGTPYAILENVIVDESYRGKRLGELLIRSALELASQAGCYKVTLTSNKRRTDAHRFYERLGFQRTHEAFRINL